jgi:hypothetical protein
MILGRLYTHQYSGHAQTSIEVNNEIRNDDQIFHAISM